MFEDVRPQESHNLEGQLRLNKDMIIATLTHIDVTHKVVKTNFLHLLSDRDHLLQLNEIYFDALRRKEDEADKLTYKLKATMDSLKSTQMALQELENQVDELCLELRLTHSSSSE